MLVIGCVGWKGTLGNVEAQKKSVAHAGQASGEWMR